VTKDMEKAEALNVFFAMIFTVRLAFRNPRTLRSVGNTQVHGTWWDGPMSAEGAGQCHCKATADNL